MCGPLLEHLGKFPNTKCLHIQTDTIYFLPQRYNKCISPVKATKSAASWEPPSPLPWAYNALLKAGRSAFIGGSVGSVGFSGFSSQPSLPFQAFSVTGLRGGEGGHDVDDDEVDHEGDEVSAFGAGPARIHTRLRCGDVLPMSFKFGFFGDITADGQVSEDDATVYSRDQYPLADAVYRAGIIVKLDSDITSYTMNENLKRVSFNDTMDYVRTLSAIADNQTIVMHLVGWQSSGHDTGYPTYDVISECQHQHSWQRIVSMSSPYRLLEPLHEQ